MLIHIPATNGLHLLAGTYNTQHLQFAVASRLAWDVTIVS